MSENPFEAILKATESLSRCVQTHLSRLFPAPQNHHHRSSPPPLFVSSKPSGLLQSTDAASPMKEKSAIPLTKEELGRSTWTLLHTIAAQFPDHPTRQQKHDVKELMVILSRLYPCKECADHFKEILKANPVQAGSQAEFSQWLCHVHNIVNRSLGKLTFPCNRVNARWGKLDCKDRACDLQGTTDFNYQP
uniref:Sulfhydryl oxidase n=2 Tax=Elaeis guineensis var. tenera TaxID=51953 RepID=A0A6I9QGJ9_ELAGV|nr:FAD-linked sulfhydryl oxidase ERV1 isoform X1 [Elaeis guineensis]